MITQSALQTFQEEMGKVMRDPYKVLCVSLTPFDYLSAIILLNAIVLSMYVHMVIFSHRVCQLCYCIEYVHVVILSRILHQLLVFVSYATVLSM